MQQYGVEELQKLLKVSKSLAEENYNRYQKFDQADTPMKQALFAYNGSVFKTIQHRNNPQVVLNVAEIGHWNRVGLHGFEHTPVGSDKSLPACIYVKIERAEPEKFV